MISALFDDHFESLVVWKEAGLKGLTCLHIDAHLDVMSEGFTSDILGSLALAQSREELEPFRTDSRLPIGGLHCGNYLYPALFDGTVRELIWLVPPHVISGESFLDGVRQQLQRWVNMDLKEYADLHLCHGAVVGSLAGCPFTVCTTDHFVELTPEQHANLALDIDIDYFVRESDDAVWQTPYQLSQILGSLTPVAVTVAMSVEGGYTPVHQRFLGRATSDLFSGRTPNWEEQVTELLEIDSASRPQDRVEGWTSLLSRFPEWMLPAVYCRLGESETALKLDAEYQFHLEDQAARLLAKKNYAQGLELLASSGPQLGLDYLRAHLALGLADFVEAKRSLTRLLEDASVSPLARFRFLILKSTACCSLGEFKLALELAQQASELVPSSAESVSIQATCCQKLGDLKKAGRLIRKALRLADGRVSSLEMMLTASRLYEQLGQAALAQSVRRELAKVDTTGRYAIAALLDASKL